MKLIYIFKLDLRILNTSFLPSYNFLLNVHCLSFLLILLFLFIITYPSLLFILLYNIPSPDLYSGAISPPPPLFRGSHSLLTIFSFTPPEVSCEGRPHSRIYHGSRKICLYHYLLPTLLVLACEMQEGRKIIEF